MGLEQEIEETIGKAMASDPIVQAAAKEVLPPDDVATPADVHELLASVQALNARVFAAHREALLRLAREIEALRSK
jgi:hypothetical protein